MHGSGDAPQSNRIRNRLTQEVLVENIVIGIILGAVFIGFIALITIIVRIAFVVSEMSAIVKSVYVATNKIEQMTQATMEASENFVDALSKATQVQAQSESPRTGPHPFFQVYKTDPTKNFNDFLDAVRKDTGLSENDMEELRKLFEDNSKDEDNEEDDNDEPKEPWKE